MSILAVIYYFTCLKMGTASTFKVISLSITITAEMLFNFFPVNIALQWIGLNDESIKKIWN